MMSENEILKMREAAWLIANREMEKEDTSTGLSFTGVAQACEQILGIKDWGLLG